MLYFCHRHLSRQFFVTEKILSIPLLNSCVKKLLPNLCIHWKPEPHSVKTLFMFRMYSLTLVVSLVIPVRMSSEIIYHLTYSILTDNKSSILPLCWHCLSTPHRMCSEYWMRTFKKQIMGEGKELIMREVRTAFMIYLPYFLVEFNFKDFWEQF